MNLAQLKQDAREELKRAGTYTQNLVEDGYGGSVNCSYYEIYEGEADKFLDTLIDKVVDEMEQVIVEGYVEGYRDAKDKATWKAQDVLERKVKPHSLMQLLNNFRDV